MKIFFKQNKKYSTGFTRTPKFGVTPKGGGFTLVETLVALSVFSISIVALMSILGKGISDIGYAKKKEIATYLAQEGVELMRNIRDTHVLYNAGGAQAGWTAFITSLTDASACQNTTNGCYLNVDSLLYSDNSQPIIDINPIACGTNCPTMSYNSSTGKYGYTGTSAGYIRKIWVTPASPVNEVKVFSRVSWTQGSGNYNVTFSESLYNWVE